jgi:hypothetical protein
VSARRWSPDVVVLPTLVALAVLLFAGVRTIPDYVRGRPAAPPATAPAGEGPAVQDFAYNFNYARSAAQERHVSPYSVAEHRRFLTAWLGPQITSSACFAYGPTILLVWGPLFAFPTAWAWLVWNVVGAATVTAGVRATANDERRPLLLGALGLLTPTVFYCLVLGQTALFTSGIFAATVLFARRGRSIPHAVLGAAFGLFLLTMKPPLALAAGAALVAAARWETLAVAGAAALAMLGAAIVWWSPELLHDYRTLLASYNLVDAPPLFRAGFHPELMTNLRNVLLHAGFDDARASHVTWIPLAATLAFPAAYAVLVRRRVPIEVAAACTATAYTLFSPHLTPTEDVVLVMVMLWLWHASTALSILVALCLGIQFFGGATFALLFQLGLAPPGAALLPVIAFGAKLGVFALAAATLAYADRRRDVAATAS